MSDELRLQIRHHTGFHYEGHAKSSYNEARMTPQTSPTQAVEQTRLAVRPVVPTYSYLDYFGTLVTAFDIGEIHDDLEVESTSTVLTRPAVVGIPMRWRDLDDESFIDRMGEYLTLTRRTEIPEAALAGVDQWRTAADLHETVAAVGEFVRGRVQYVTGSTNVSTTATEAWDRGQGVCQDMTHLTLGILRSLGIPARYVSGYFYPKKTVEMEETIRAQSHAWVEYFSGEWTGIDPTNGIGHTARHIVVGRGRDYGDVSPLKGIYQGPKSTGTGAVVEITRLP